MCENTFLLDHYEPCLQKYKYHHSLIVLFGKYHTKKDRNVQFKKHKNWFFTERDYAERLKKEMDNELQSDHFGDSISLSIEGCSLKYHLPNSINQTTDRTAQIGLDFHSHMSDYSKQNAASTYEHMVAMFDSLKKRNGDFDENTVFLDHTDGCSKQYRSANALHLLSVLAVKYTVIIDRSVSAPGHGKSIIDGLNAVDKHYLRKVMCMSGSMYFDNEDRRMNAHSMTETASQSFAEECVRLCSQSDRENGVFDSIKNEGKENKGKLTTRFYHLHKQEDVTYDNINKDSYGWGAALDVKNGMSCHHNIRADPYLGIGKLAVRRIPCMCDACTEKIKLPWDFTATFNDQPRYKGGNEQCKYWDVMKANNDWKLIFTEEKKIT